MRSLFSKAKKVAGVARFACVSLICACCAAASHAEVAEVRIASGFGVQYLPLYVMKQHNLLEKHAKRAGLGEIKVAWLQFSGGAALNDAILAGAVDFVEGGVGPMAQLWDKTRGNMNIKSLASMGDVPMTLYTNSARIRRLQDFADGDKIAVPAVKASMQAVLLQMAVAKLYGDKSYDRLDRLTVTMPHADALAAMLSRSGTITAHFAAPPFADQALADPAVFKLTDSLEIIGGPMTLNTTYLREKFYADNPRTVRAYLEALKETMALINSDRKEAARVYIIEGKSKLAPETVEKILSAKGVEFTVVPHGTLKFVQFMHQVGLIRNRPESWKDLFFPEVHDLPGS